MKFADKVLKTRAILDLSQAALAERLNVSFMTINRWEHGKANPTKKAELRFEDFCRRNNVLFDENND